MKRKGKQGAVLFYTLVIVGILAIVTSATVAQFQQSTLMAKRLEAESKAYWTAKTGLEYARYRIGQDYTWPTADKLVSEKKFGDYTVTEQVKGSCIVIYGTDSKKENEFYIAFNASPHKVNTIYGDYMSAVPASKPQDMENKQPLEYFSYNRCHTTQESYDQIIINNMGNTSSTKAILEKNNISHALLLKVSDKKTHFVNIPATGIYVSAEGRTRSSKSVIESIFYIEANTQENTPFQSAIYCGKDLEVDLVGQGASFSVSQIEGNTPSIMCSGDFTINRNRNHKPDDGKNAKVNKPIEMTNGTVFCPQNFQIENSSVDREKGNEYGFNLIKADMNKYFPELTWEEFTQYEQTAQFEAVLPAGTYAYIDTYKTVVTQTKEKDEHGHEKIVRHEERLPTGEYTLHYFNMDLNEKQAVNYILSLSDEELAQAEVKKLSEKPPDPPPTYDEEGNQTGGGTSPLTPLTYKSLKGFEQNMSPMFSFTEDIVDGGYYLDDAKVSLTSRNSDPEIKLLVPTCFQATTNSSKVQLLAVERGMSEAGAGLGQGNLAEFKQLKITLEHPLVDTTLSAFDKTAAHKASLPMLYSDCEMTLRGQIQGKGEIVTANNISFESLGDTSQQANQLAIYARGDIEIKPKTVTEDNSDVKLEEIDRLLKTSFNRTISANKGSGTVGELFETISNTPFERTLIKHRRNSKTGEWETYEEIIEKPLYLVMFEEKGYTNVTIKGLITEYIVNNSTRSGKNGLGLPLRTISTADWTTTNKNPAYVNGIIYTWGNFYADMQERDLVMEGLLVAYGGEPGKTGAGSSDGGNITIKNCSGFHLTYNPDNSALFSRIPIYTTLRYNQLMFNRLF